MVDEESCKILLEELGYEVRIPRLITEYNACIAVNMWGARSPSGGGRYDKQFLFMFGQIAMSCSHNVQSTGVVWRERYLRKLEEFGITDRNIKRITNVEESIRKSGVQL